MNRPKKIIWFLFISTTITTPMFSYPTPVDFDGKLLRWNLAEADPPILWEVVADESINADYYRTAIEESAALWSSVEGSYLRLAEVTEGANAKITINLKSEIEGGDYSSGYSLFDESNARGPTHCAMTILAGPQEYGVSKTILHEFGHCLGLGHSMVAQAIMSYSLEENRFALDIDDKAVIARLYPADGSDPSLPLGCSVGFPFAGQNFLVVMILLLLPLGLAFWNLSRSKPGKLVATANVVTTSL